MPDMFSNFEGEKIDAASLGFLQVDKKGNVNPSMLPNKIFGPGGFLVIAGVPLEFTLQAHLEEEKVILLLKIWK
jgi:acyl CoA:acetate/3-ketoacid CoA transferase